MNSILPEPPVEGRLFEESIETRLHLWQQEPEIASYLQIASIPDQEWINLEENRYILLIQPQGVRACGGQYRSDEAHQIAKSTKGWDWSLDENNRPSCLPALERLLDLIIKQSSQGGKL